MQSNQTRARLVRTALILISLITLVVVVAPAPSPVAAQDGQTLPFGELQLGIVNGPEGTLFNFQGQSGDAIEIEVAGLTNFLPAVALQASDRSIVAQENNAARQTSITLNATLPSTGTFFILVTGLDNAIGQFTIVINRGLPQGLPLNPNATTDGIIAPTLPQVYYDLPLDPGQNTRLEIRSLTQGYTPQVTVFSENGTPIAFLNGQRFVAGSLEFNPGNETLKVLVELGQFTEQASYQVLWTVVPLDGSGAGPVVTQEPSESSNTGSSTACAISGQDNNAINVRSGGSQNHPIIAALQPGQSAAGIAFNGANGLWYQIRLPDGTIGWIASFVVNTSGDCSNLPTASYPAAPSGGGNGGQPQQTTEPDETETGTPVATTEPGETETETPEETTEPGETETETPEETVQVAPVDNEPVAQFELNFKNNDSRTITNTISYSGGDNADRVRYVIVGFDQVTFSATATVVVTCSGPGAENAMVRWNWGSQQGVSCSNAQRNFTYTDDSDFTNFEVYLPSGDNAYVTWTATIISSR